MIFRSIVGKIWLTVVGLVLGILLILGVFLGQLVDRFYLQTVVDDLTRQAAVVGDTLETYGVDTAYAYARILGSKNNATFAIADSSGRVNACGKGMHNRRMWWQLSEDEQEQINSGQIVIRKGRHDNFDLDMISVAVPVKNTLGEVEWTVLIYAPLEPISDTVNKLQGYVVAAAGGALLLATVLAFFVSVNISKPILRLNNAAQGMASGDFSQRVNSSSNDEIGLLTNTFNHLSERLDDTLQALNKEKGQLSNIVTSMSDGVITLDIQGKIILVNPRANYLFLGRSDTVLEGNINDFCENQTIKDLFEQVIKTGQIQNGSVERLDKHLAVRMAPLKNDREQVIGVVVLLHDISRQWKLEKVRKDFVANVSHELRTPLTLIKGYGEALQEGMGETPEARDELVNVITDEASRMQRLVEDLLSTTRLDNENARLNKEEFSVTQLANKVVSKFYQYSQEQNVNVFVNNCSKDICYYGDKDKLEQVIFNLLENGIKHTGEGGQVSLAIEQVDLGVKIIVKDTGVGISEDELPFIWDRFYKVEKSRNRKFVGTGLGLHIVKGIVEAHQGYVEAESKVGVGSTFTAHLPKQ